MSRWQRFALPVLVAALVAFAALFFLERGDLRDSRTREAASAAQVEALTEQVSDLQSALEAALLELAAANAKIDALSTQVQSLGGDPVASTGSTGTPPTTSPPPSGEQQTEPECVVNVFGLCV